MNLSSRGIQVVEATYPAVLSADGELMLQLGFHDMISGAPTPQPTSSYHDLDSLEYRAHAPVVLPPATYYGAAVWSADSRYFAFTAWGLDGFPDTPTGYYAYVEDSLLGLIRRASETWNGLAADVWQGELSISRDGRYVAFLSYHSLVPGDTNGNIDVFVKDMQSGAIERASIGVLGNECQYPPYYPIGNHQAIRDIRLSGDGRSVAFLTVSDDMSPQDSNLAFDCYVRDLDSDVSELVSVNATGQTSYYGAPGGCGISHDGRFVTFSSASVDIVPGFTPVPSAMGLFSRDRTSATTIALNEGLGASPPNGQLGFGLVFVSSNGRHVAFESEASNLVPGDTNGAFDVFVRDTLTGTTIRASVSSLGSDASGGGGADGRLRGLSEDGSRVLWDSASDAVVPGDTNLRVDAFLFDANEPPTVSDYCLPRPAANGCTPSIATGGSPDFAREKAFFITSSGAPNNRLGRLLWSYQPAAPPYHIGMVCLAPPFAYMQPQSTAGNPGAGTDCSGWLSYEITPDVIANEGWTLGQPIYAQFWLRDPTVGLVAFSKGLSFSFY